MLTVDHYVLLIIYLTNAFHNKRFQTLFNDKLDRSKATCSFNKLHNYSSGIKVYRDSEPQCVMGRHRGHSLFLCVGSIAPSLDISLFVIFKNYHVGVFKICIVGMMGKGKVTHDLNSSKQERP